MEIIDNFIEHPCTEVHLWIFLKSEKLEENVNNNTFN